jgi:XTP/dITP diphosphohydrolase
VHFRKFFHADSLFFSSVQAPTDTKKLYAMPSLPARMILGTHNRKKCGELRELLVPLGIELKSLAEVEQPLVVDETGTSFIENARLKASQQACHLGEWTIGEDSGLCVPALGGAPGIYSARYSGENATDEMNNAKLLADMSELENDKRNAYYVCTIALSDPTGEIHLEAEGRCWGRILKEQRGVGGFGYDPMFELREYHLTFAELGGTVKSVLSHRARALEKFTRALRGWPKGDGTT